jgi:hypothetical protein
MFCSLDESGCDANFLADSHFALCCVMISFWRLGCSDAPFSFRRGSLFFVFVKLVTQRRPLFF